MRLYAFDPISFLSACMCDRQDLNMVLLLTKDADVWKADNSAILKIKMDSREPCRIRLDLKQKTGESPTEPFCDIKGSRKIPVNHLVDFDCCFEAKTNHRLSLLSILRFTSSHGIPGEGSLALRSNSCRKAGSSTEKLVFESSNESKSSFAKSIRSASGSRSADFRISSWDIDIRSSDDDERTLSSIVNHSCNLRSRPPLIVAEFIVVEFQNRSRLLWLIVRVLFDDDDAIVRQSQHETASVVPFDIDLRPITP